MHTGAGMNMGLFSKYFVDVKRGTKITYSESDLRKLDRNYEKEVIPDRERKVMSAIRRVPQYAYLTQTRDYAFEQILDKHMYTFSHILVVPNPYNIVKQSALLLFNSSKETKIRYRVLGDTEDADFTGETDYTKRHRVPIMGLYLERSNKVLLEMIDKEEKVIKRRMLRIYVSETPVKLQNVVKKVENRKKSHIPFIMINGAFFNPMVLDCNGDIRYSIQLRTNNIGMIPLKNGHFLYEDRTANRMAVNGKTIPCRYHEMDYMGRVYATYLIDAPIQSTIAESEDSLFVLTSLNGTEQTEGILELDRKNLQVKKSCNLNELLGDRYSGEECLQEVTSLCCQGDYLYLTLQKLHTALKLNWQTKQLVWIMAPEGIWEGTKAESYLLQGECEEKACLLQPNDIMIMSQEETGNDELVIFSSMSAGKVKADCANGKKSCVFRASIDVSSKSFSIGKIHYCNKNRKFGRVIYSDDQSDLLLGLGSMVKKEGEVKSKFCEVNRETGELIREIGFSRNFTRMWEFTPAIATYGHSIPKKEEVLFGNLCGPELFTGELPPVSEKPISSYFSGSVLCDEVLCNNILPGRIDAVYFIGKEHRYVQWYKGMLPEKVKFPYAIALGDLEKDEYTIYVECRGVVHRLKNEIRIVR